MDCDCSFGGEGGIGADAYDVVAGGVEGERFNVVRGW